MLDQKYIIFHLQGIVFYQMSKKKRKREKERIVYIIVSSYSIVHMIFKGKQPYVPSKVTYIHSKKTYVPESKR